MEHGYLNVLILNIQMLHICDMQKHRLPNFLVTELIKIKAPTVSTQPKDPELIFSLQIKCTY